MKKKADYNDNKVWLIAKQPLIDDKLAAIFDEKVRVFQESYGMTLDKARIDAYFMMCGVNFND